MNKNELIARVALTQGTSKTAAAASVEAVLDAIGHGVMRDNEVMIVGFGKFTRVVRPERVGRNPQTGAPIVMEEKHVVRFKPGKSFADLVAGK